MRGVRKRSCLSIPEIIQLKWLLGPEPPKTPISAIFAVRFLDLGLVQHSPDGLVITAAGRSIATAAKGAVVVVTPQQRLGKIMSIARDMQPQD